MDEKLEMDQSIPEIPEDNSLNFNENPDENVPVAVRREIVKPIFPNQKLESPNAVLNKEAHKRKIQAQRKFKNKQARIARRKNRR